MLHSTSVKLRLLVSVGSNALRAVLGFTTGVLIARALNPAGYGDMMFLLGSFTAVRSLLDLGSSSAFFTFLSQRARARPFYLLYFFWLAIQFIATLIFLWLIIPPSLFEKIWLGHERGVVVLAFVAIFMQQQVWQMVGQIGEAMRKTIMVQLMNLAVALSYLTLIALASVHGGLTVEKIFYLMIGQYVIASIFSYRILRQPRTESIGTDNTLGEIIRYYWKYCRPLVILAMVSFAYDFADKWMLQKFGGSAQQGYFQISSQFAAVSLLATVSILNVFWKEMAVAWEKQDLARVEMLYRKVSRGLVMLGAMASGLLIPWSEQILRALLGMSFESAWPILAIMLLYPIHQSMGQVGGAMMFATGQTQKYTIVSIAIMLVSIPASYILLAPVDQKWLPGLELGAMGMALKMVILGFVSVNVQAWVIARYSGWKFDWVFQVVGIPLMIVLGYVAKACAVMLWNIRNGGITETVALAILTTILYMPMAAVTVWRLPWLIGLGSGDIDQILRRVGVILAKRERN